MLKARVLITLKDVILDPQGKAIGQALNAHGFKEVIDARVGKVIDIKLQQTDRKLAKQTLKKMADALLCNPLIENISYEFID